MPFFEEQGLRYFQFSIFNELPLFHAVLTRRGGFSQGSFSSLNFGGTVGDNPDDVLKNHQKTFEVLGYPFGSRFDVWQVHGTDILCAVAPRDPNSGFQKADGILTDNPGISLFMRFADCVPILLADPNKGVIGIIHAGWQGTAQQISRIAVERMRESYGSDPDDIYAGIGPSICPSCYQVGEEVLTSFTENFGKEAEKFFLSEKGTLFLDLWEANRFTLTSSGVKNIEIAGLCTAENLDDWFSHRAENGKTGRFGVLMSLLDN
jgi:YfiH family protein